MRPLIDAAAAGLATDEPAADGRDPSLAAATPSQLSWTGAQYLRRYHRWQVRGAIENPAGQGA